MMNSVKSSTLPAACPSTKTMAQLVRVVAHLIGCLLLCSAIPVCKACPVECECIVHNTSSHVTCTDQSLTSTPEGIHHNITGISLHGNKIINLSSVFHIFTDLITADVSFNNIQSVHDNNLLRNKNLKVLNLSYNNITSLGDYVFTNVPNLLVINLSNNNIGVLRSAIFQNLLSLQHLDLRNNSLETLPTDAFTNLTELQSLDLSYNQITTIPDALFQYMNNLKTLNLQHNQMTSFDGVCLFSVDGVHLFSVISNLEYIDLSFNLLENVTNLTFPGLKHLDLAGNNISQFTSNNFRNLDNLTVLILDRNPTGSVTQAVFEQLSSLRNLSMCYMPSLTYLSPNTFKGLSSLERLKLANNPQLSFIHQELFAPLSSVSIIDLSYNSITNLRNASFQHNMWLSILDIQGNAFPCDCSIDWIIEEIQLNSSIFQGVKSLACVNLSSDDRMLIYSFNLDMLHCSEVTIVNHSSDSSFRIGRSAILKCVASSDPSPEITWITPRNRVLKYHYFHPLSSLSYLPINDTAAHKMYHSTHDWHEQPSYYSQSETRPDRIVVLEDGSLYIDYVMRMDGGPYKCIASNPRNSSEVTITVLLDYSVLHDVYVWSLVVGFSCAGACFFLNLTYSLTLVGVRKCISQRRHERIRHMIETIDKYKTARLSSIKEHYNNQVGKIRDQYHYQLGRLREHHQNQVNRMGRMREGASQKMEKLRENYNNQLSRLKDYSSSQLVQLRERYSSQVDKIKDYGNDKLDRIHEKYKIKQQHVIKLFEMMNLDNCKTVFDSECVRAESMILQSEVFTGDIPLHSPIDSVSVSESEYMTATSSESSRYASHEDMHAGEGQEVEMVPINPYQSENSHPGTSSDHSPQPNCSGYTETHDDELPSASYTANNKQTDSIHRKHNRHNRDRMRLPSDDDSEEEAQRLYMPDRDLRTQPPQRRVNTNYNGDFFYRSQHHSKGDDLMEGAICSAAHVHRRSNADTEGATTPVHKRDKAVTNRHSSGATGGSLEDWYCDCIIKESIV